MSARDRRPPRRVTRELDESKPVGRRDIVICEGTCRVQSATAMVAGCVRVLAEGSHQQTVHVTRGRHY